MRLLRLGPGDELTLTKFNHDLPPYAILSHTWGHEGDEVNLRDIMEKTGKDKPGYQKIVFCGEQARTDSLDYFWVDTCCIDKTSSSELSESINSMFKWYQDAKICYVYLADVSNGGCGQSEAGISGAIWQSAFKGSKWFTRGWTLQELLAPMSVRFFDQHGSLLGDKSILNQQVSDITGIAERALLGVPLTNFKISERYEWARSRKTTHEEDWAYSLQGIFGVFFVPVYGEGKEKAVRRLVKEIKEDRLGVEMQSVTIDAVRRGEIAPPLLLDIAFLETLVLFDETRAQAERYKSNIHANKKTLLRNDVLVSDTVSMFFAFLRQLLWTIALPWGVQVELEGKLDASSLIIRQVIASNEEIASGLKDEGECGQKTLSELEKFQDLTNLLTQKANAQSSTLEEMQILRQYIGHTKPEVKEMEEKKEKGIIKEAEKIMQQDEEYAKLKEQVPKLREECQKIRQSLELTLEEGRAQRTKIDAKVNKLEEKIEEAERFRRECQNKTVWQKIAAWIFYILTCGSDD